MNEIQDNILNYIGKVDAICITTNGAVKKNGACVMGAGVAKLFRDTYKGIDVSLGNAIKRNGNITQPIRVIDNTTIIAFPTKHHWEQKADLNLITESYYGLINLINNNDFKSVILPRPGCSNGGLDWRTVKFRLFPIWDDRITIIYL